MEQIEELSNGNISADISVVTSTYVMNDGLPILEVSHEDDEEGGSLWQFHCGNGDYEVDNMLLVRFDTVLALDRSLMDVVSLPKGQTATRQNSNAAWHRS